MNVEPMQFAEAPIFQPDILEQIPFLNGGHPSAIRPMENLSNRYFASTGLPLYGSQASPIARTNPPVKAATSPVTLNKSGMGSTYRLADESLRQYSLGAFLQNKRDSFYQTRP
jgi:hypothetical protein